jgi:hypothetical protein
MQDGSGRRYAYGRAVGIVGEKRRIFVPNKRIRVSDVRVDSLSVKQCGIAENG